MDAGGCGSGASGIGIEEQDVLVLLSRLVDKSLVNVDSDVEASRYRFLETVRQYAREHLLSQAKPNACAIAISLFLRARSTRRARIDQGRTGHLVESIAWGTRQSAVGSGVVPGGA